MSPLVSAPRPLAERGRLSTRRATVARPPRRVSGPVRGRAAAADATAPRSIRAPREGRPLGARALALVRGLPEHSLIDRLVRGRAWIPVLGVLLAGIVAMQVEILKLGATMGRAMERSTLLQTENESLQANLAGLADDQRIERLASGMGMIMPTAESLRFLSARPGGAVGRALSNIHSPDPVTFINQLAAEAAAAAALLPPPPPGTSSTTGSVGIVPGTAAAPTPTTTITTPAAGSTSATAVPTSGAATAPTVASMPSSPTSSPGAITAPAAPAANPASPATGAAPTGSGAAGIAPAASAPPSASGGG